MPPFLSGNAQIKQTAQLRLPASGMAFGGPIVAGNVTQKPRVEQSL